MSPAVTSAYPVLFSIFGGRQSARTIHFFAADLLVLFLLIHVIMTIRAGVVASMITRPAEAK
jgi:thiosulfate reductase cytochrome b subunit